MLAWLIKVFIGEICFHKWETKNETKLDNASGSTGRRVYLCCSKCGNWKKQDLIS